MSQNFIGASHRVVNAVGPVKFRQRHITLAVGTFQSDSCAQRNQRRWRVCVIQRHTDIGRFQNMTNIAAGLEAGRLRRPLSFRLVGIPAAGFQEDVAAERCHIAYVTGGNGVHSLPKTGKTPFYVFVG